MSPNAATATLRTRLSDLGQPAYRARQAEEARRHGAMDWDDITSWPKSLRQTMAEGPGLWAVAPRVSAKSEDGTVKWLFSADDGAQIEAVSIAHGKGRRTVCVSSQVGCALGCRFCATGKLGAGRNLRADEIIDQVVYAHAEAERIDERVSNVVFMGMGEPMQNLDAVLDACRYFTDPDEGLGLSGRRVAISTAGWVPGISALAASDVPVRLAISLHAADDTTRSALMPINNRWPIANLMAECRRYCDTTGRRVFIEYLLLHEINDRPEDAKRLASLVRDGNFHINLIQFNPTGGDHRASSSERRERFIIALERLGVTPSVRRSRGADIAAACGQLALSTGSTPPAPSPED